MLFKAATFIIEENRIIILYENLSNDNYFEKLIKCDAGADYVYLLTIRFCLFVTQLFYSFNCSEWYFYLTYYSITMYKI